MITPAAASADIATGQRDARSGEPDDTALYRDVRAAFERLIERDPGQASFKRLADGEARWRAVVGACVDSLPDIDPSEADWADPAAWRWVGCAPAEARTAAAFAASLDPVRRAALGALVRRGHDGFMALDTLPLSALFSADELAVLAERPRATDPVPRQPSRWRPGEPFDYAGVLAVIMKVTRLCNLRCTYCHDWRTGPDQTMRFDVQVEMFSAVFGPDEHRQVQLIWHGGEPTSIGRRAFLRILRLQRFFMRPGQTLSNRVQTNALAVDARWIDFWRSFGIRVSASIDGDRQTHDEARPRVNGRGSYALVRRGIEALAAAKLLDAVYWVIKPEDIVAGAPSVWSAIQQLGVPEIGLIPVDRRDAAGAPASNDATSFARFLLELRAARRARPEPWVAIREIDAAERALRGAMPGFCELLGNCIGHVFAVEPDGAIQHCDRFLGEADYIVGHVARGGFVAARRGAKIVTLRARERERLDRFRSCPHFRTCQGWCPHMTFGGQPWIIGSDDNCCGLRPLLDGIEGDLRAGPCPH